MTELKAGDAFPDGVTFSYVPPEPGRDIKTCGIPQSFDVSKEAKAKKIVVVAVPGAFTPTCQASHLPSYLENKAALRAKGVDRVIVAAFNDAYVMSAWGTANGVGDDFIIFACDEGAKFSKQIGWTLGERTGRYAIAVDHGKVVYAGKDEAGKVDGSGAEAVLARL